MACSNKIPIRGVRASAATGSLPSAKGRRSDWWTETPEGMRGGTRLTISGSVAARALL
ncbi:hypothetical protein GGQ17_000359 [Salinibacter ruber]|nr:hypothetical protein [Salinibacter ruber]